MKPQHIVATCLRFLAVIWILYVLSRVNTTFSFARTDSQLTINGAVVWGSALLQIAVCAVLWFYPMTIAARLVPGGVKAADTAPPQLVEWQTLGLVCIGLWGLVHVIPLFAYWITVVSMSHDKYDAYEGLRVEDKALIFAHVVELALSLWLVFGAKGLASILFKMRTGGISKT